MREGMTLSDRLELLVERESNKDVANLIGQIQQVAFKAEGGDEYALNHLARIVRDLARDRVTMNKMRGK